MTWREQCENYIRLHAQKAQVEKELRPLAEAIKAGLKEGKASPADLPYLLILRTSERTEKDYRTPLFAALRKLLGSREKAEARMEKIESQFETKPVDSLHVEQNKALAAQLS